MYKLIILGCIMCVNVYANKNWININSNSGSNFKMYKPSSSYTKSSSYKSSRGQEIKLIDTKLIKSIRQVQGQVKGINNR